MPCPLTWHSARVAASAATPFLCRRNAAMPRVARQWVRPRSSAMSIDVALSTRRGVGRDTYSLPKKNAAAPRDHVNGHGPTKLRSRDHVNGHGPTKRRPRDHVNGHGTTKLRSWCHVNGHGPTKLRPGTMSMDMALLSCAPVPCLQISFL